MVRCVFTIGDRNESFLNVASNNLKTAMARKEVHARKEERLKEKAVKTMEPVAAQSSDNPTTSSGTIMATSSPTNFKPFRVPTRVGTTLPQFTAARVVAPGQPMFNCHSPGAIVMPDPPPGHPLRREVGMVQVLTVKQVLDSPTENDF